MASLEQSLAQMEHERRVLVTQAAVLESIARGATLDHVLRQLCELIERHSDGALCSVLLLDERSGTLRAAAGPSLSPDYVAALDGIEPGEGAGSCGTAAVRGEPVIVCDIAHDPLWDSFRELALRFDIRSCWSSPIVGHGGQVLGTFAISHPEPREPSEEHLELLRTASDLAGIAVERENALRANERLTVELQNQQRLESLGILAGGIAHDFNNLMTAVTGNLSLASSRVSDREALGYLKAAEEACEQSKILSGRFLAFAKGGAPVRGPVDLADVVREAASFALAGSDLACKWSADEPIPAVDGDRSQLLQVVANLLMNADQATPGGGIVAVRAVERSVREGDAPGLEPGSYVVLSVEDEGVGIDPEDLGRVFDPYFTTKLRGSGLGLATVYSIVRAHGGRVDVRSQAGGGSLFEVHLPASAEPARAASAPAPRQDPATGSVLLMDDEPAVLKVAATLLRQAGYEVVEVENGDSAIERFRQARLEGRGFDAVVLDLTVRPGMGGQRTIAALREMEPEIAAVVASGYSGDSVLADPRAHGFDAAVAKPFGREELVAGIREALELRRRAG